MSSPAGSPAASSTASPTSTDDAAALANAASTRIAQSLPAGAVSVAATDLDTGQSFSFGATAGMVTASVVKLELLEVLLLQHQRSGTPLDDDSDALITVDGDLIAISVLTQHNSDEQSGVTLVESLAKIAADAVG
ncbi:MAG: hypothetical protein QOE97_3893 [Pseudonocardiales bacterium]|jgi:beta-lactamase class A|nr:hypothetical protein [Pseudonocardiales bacterium]